MARFKVLHGNVSANMGRYYNGVGYLLPEEVLLLADLGNLILWFQGYPLSLQEVYDFALEHIDAGDYLVSFFVLSLFCNGLDVCPFKATWLCCDAV